MKFKRDLLLISLGAWLSETLTGKFSYLRLFLDADSTGRAGESTVAVKEHVFPEQTGDSFGERGHSWNSREDREDSEASPDESEAEEAASEGNSTNALKYLRA